MSYSNYNYTSLAHFCLNIQTVFGSEVNLHTIHLLVTKLCSYKGNLCRDLVHGTNLKGRFCSLDLALSKIQSMPLFSRWRLHPYRLYGALTAYKHTILYLDEFHVVESSAMLHSIRTTNFCHLNKIWFLWISLWTWDEGCYLLGE
jgi:hypothetical protein